MKILIHTVLVMICTVSSTQASYTARDFFEDASPDCISAVEPIRQGEKDSIIASEYELSPDLDSPFSVVSVDSCRLQLRDVDIHVYHQDAGGWIVSVTSILGSHRENQHSSFFEVDSSGVIVSELSQYDLGLVEVLSNEFLDIQDHFSEETNYPVPFYIMDDGSFQAEPWTWMNPDWEDREIVFEIRFVWTGESFSKEASRLSS